MSIENLGKCLHKGSYTPGSVFAHKSGYSSISTPSYVSVCRDPLQNSESELETGGYTYLTLNKALFH